MQRFGLTFIALLGLTFAAIGTASGATTPHFYSRRTFNDVPE